MIVHIGGEISVNSDDIIGVFDLDNTSVSKKTREFLTKAQRAKKIKEVSYELPRTFIVCSDSEKRETVYLTQISSKAIARRAESAIEEEML